LSNLLNNLEEVLNLNKLFSILAVFILTFSLFPKSKVVKATGQSEKHYLIEFNKELNTQVIEKTGGKVKGKYNNLKVVIASLNDTEFEKLRNNPEIKNIEEDAKVEAYPLSGKTFLENGYSWATKRVNANSSHEKGITGKGLKLAILDTGISANSGLTIKQEVSLVDSEPNIEDTNGHGTTLASIIAASLEKTGFIGIAPAVDLYNVKVLNKDGVGNYSDIIEGIEWAIDKDVNIINMSFGGTNNSQILENSINNAYKKGILLVSSVGNNGEDKITYPAAYNNVIGVGSTDYYNNKASFSNYGKQLELVAPGINIPAINSNGNLVTVSGTSASAAYVSGVSALLWSQNLELNNEQLRKILKKSSTKLNSYNGYGLVNAEPNITQIVENSNSKKPDSQLTNDEMSFLLEAGWSKEAISETPLHLLKEFISEGAMNPDSSESTYIFKTPDQVNGDVQTQDLKNGGEITLRVTASYVGIVSGYKQFKITGSYDWNSMPINRYTDLFAVAWTDNAFYNSTSKLAQTWYGAIPITDYISVYNSVLKAGMSWKVDLHAGTHDDKGSFTQYVNLPTSATSASLGPFQAKVEYSHAFTTISPSIGGGSSGFTYGIVPGITTDFADNPPISSVYY
jgi:hypothetical protein